jgi:hypothetical protein
MLGILFYVALFLSLDTIADMLLAERQQKHYLTDYDKYGGGSDHNSKLLEQQCG